MLRLLADSCIWLDLVKDYRREPVLSAVENLVKGGSVSLVVPHVVINEFARNKDRVVKEGLQGIAPVLKRARDVVAQFGTDAGKPAALAELGDVDMRMSRNGEDMIGAVARMEKLFAGATLVRRPSTSRHAGRTARSKVARPSTTRARTAWATRSLSRPKLTSSRPSGTSPTLIAARMCLMTEDLPLKRGEKPFAPRRDFPIGVGG